MTSLLKVLLGAFCVSAVNLSSSHFFRTQEHLYFRGVFLQFLFLAVFVRSAHERLEQRMRLQRLRLEFTVKFWNTLQ